MLAVAAGPLRNGAMGPGILLLAAAVAMMVYGFTLRTAITGYTPIATMFETVAFVALIVASLGLWLAIVPLFSRGLRLAWQWTATPEPLAFRQTVGWDKRHAVPQPLPTAGVLPVDVGMTPIRHPVTPSPRRPLIIAARLLAMLARAALAAGVFYVLTMIDFGAADPVHGEPAVLLLPRVGIGASAPTVGDPELDGRAGAVGRVDGLPAPLILAGVISCAAVPLALARGGLAEPLRQVRRRRVIPPRAAGIAVLAGCAGYFVPTFDPSIKALRPILRTSFWLAVHVATIIASYGRGPWPGP